MEMRNHRPVQGGAIAVVDAIHRFRRECVPHLHEAAEIPRIVAHALDQLHRSSAWLRRRQGREYPGQVLLTEVEDLHQIRVSATPATLDGAIRRDFCFRNLPGLRGCMRIGTCPRIASG
jgi:hypothetical protein